MQKKKKYYKLTNQKMMSYGGFKWELGKWCEIDKDLRKQNLDLCSKGFFHCYDHPLLAILFNPIHANINNPRLFEAAIKGKKKTDKGLKTGFTFLKIVKELEIPKISLNQRAAFGVLCTKEAHKDGQWNDWADKWLSVGDRTTNAAASAAASAAEEGGITNINLIKIAKDAMRF